MYVCASCECSTHTTYTMNLLKAIDLCETFIHSLYMHLILCDCITQSDVLYAHMYVRAHARDYLCVCVAINV